MSPFIIEGDGCERLGRSTIIAPMKIHYFPLICTLIVASVPAPALAQSSAIKENALRLIRKIGIHGNVSFRHPLDSDVSKGWSEGVSVGLSPGRTNGWRYPFALTFFSQDLNSANGVEFASVRTRALVGGIGYGWHFGRLSTGVQVQTGYAWNHGSLNDDVEAAFNVPRGTVSLDAGDSWLVRPAVKAEYFITPKITARVSFDYVYLKPHIAVTTPNQRFSGEWPENNLHVNFGIGFYPLRKP